MSRFGPGAPAYNRLLFEAALKFVSVADERQCAAAKPVPLGVEVLLRILFWRIREETVAVAEVVEYSAVVLKFAPVLVALMCTVLYPRFTFPVDVVVRLIPRTEGRVSGLAVLAFGARRSPIRLLNMLTPPAVKLVIMIPETVGDPVEVLSML
jgi:hypothetical protein